MVLEGFRAGLPGDVTRFPNLSELHFSESTHQAKEDGSCGRIEGNEFLAEGRVFHQRLTALATFGIHFVILEMRSMEQTDFYTESGSQRDSVAAVSAKYGIGWF